MFLVYSELRLFPDVDSIDDNITVEDKSLIVEQLSDKNSFLTLFTLKCPILII